MKTNTAPFPYFAMVIAALYMAQGLPGGLIAHALPSFLREQGASLMVIGALKLLALPWLLKFIWAPLIDGNGSTQERFRWVIRMQSMMIVGLLILSLAITSLSFAAICIAIAILLLINVASATQDIATDGFTASQTPKQYLGLANSIQVAGYKVGMLIGGSGLLLLSPYFEIPALIRGLAIVIAVLLLPVYFYKQRYFYPENKLNASSQPLPNTQQDLDDRVQTKSKSALKTIISSYRDFFSQSAIKPWLLVLVTYKMADSLGSTLFKPMLIDNGVLLSDIGYLTIYSTIAGLIGAVLAGGLYRVFGMKFSLVCFGLLQSLSVSSFYVVNAWSLSINEIYILAMMEQFCDGLSTVVLFAVMMRHCRKGHEGADYTLQASLQVALAGIMGALSGLIASVGGYALLYASCALLGVISLMLSVKYVRQAKD